MRAAISLALLLAACGSGAESPEANNAAAPADVDVLPADESAATPSADLANGVSDPAVNELGNQH